MVSRSGYCSCGCGQKVTWAKRTNPRTGTKRGDFNRFVSGHQNRLSPVEYRVDECGCWVWQRGTSAGGYGVAKGIHKRQDYAHRVYYTLHKGPIPDGMELDHLCRNRRCVNPDHLEPVTTATNARRGARTKIREEQEQYIADHPEMSARAIGRHLGVHHRTVMDARRRLGLV